MLCYLLELELRMVEQMAPWLHQLFRRYLRFFTTVSSTVGFEPRSMAWRAKSTTIPTEVQLGDLTMSTYVRWLKISHVTCNTPLYAAVTADTILKTATTCNKIIIRNRVIIGVHWPGRDDVECFPNVDTWVIIVTMLTKSDLQTFIDFRDSLTWYTMGFRKTFRVDGVSSFKNRRLGMAPWFSSFSG